jgi:hypothetical protein
MKAFLSFVLLLSFLVSCQNKSSEQASESIKTDTILQKNGQVLHYIVFEKSLLKMKRDLCGNLCICKNYLKIVRL